MRNYINWLIIIIGFILVAGTFYFEKTKLLDEPNVNPYHEGINALEGQNEPLEAYLDELAYCESRNTDDVKIVDSNGYYSYGRYQYQLATWNYYIDKYDLLPHAEEAEYKNWIFDGDFQRLVTKTVLAAEPSAWRNWYTCGNAIGLYELNT